MKRRTNRGKEELEITQGVHSSRAEKW